MRLGKLLLYVSVVLAAGGIARGQQSTLSTVTFQNAGSFKQADLEAVAQLHAGEKVTIAQMQAAAQHLIDTGFFEDVNVDSKGTGTALTLIFILKPLPPEQVTEAEFENFIWLTPVELHAIVHKVVPLFDGELPESGTSLEQIDAALEAALLQKGIAAHVSYQAVMPNEDPVHRLQFWVGVPFVQIHDVTLEGVDPGLAAAVSGVAKKLKGMQLSEGDEGSSTIGRLLEPYRDAGYARASLKDVKFAAVQSSAKTVMVDVSARVEPGAVYKIGAVDFTDSPLVSAAAFAGTAKLHAGDVASRKAMVEGAKSVGTVYQKQGYFEAYVKTVPKYDDVADSVSYAMTVVPGEQYRLRTVTVQGLPPDVRAQFDQAWFFKPGDLYDPEYVRAFLTNNTAVRGLARYSGGFKAVSDPQTHLVDLMVNFAPAAGKS